MSIRKCVFCVLVVWQSVVFADTLGKYAAIAKNIPSMELKADAQSQAWARSARSVLSVTDEAIAQSVVAMNIIALKNGKPLICAPADVKINTEMVHTLLTKRIANMQLDDTNKNISSVVVTILTEQYPCNQTAQRQLNLPPITIQRVHHIQRG